jgi:hypothetical protein
LGERDELAVPKEEALQIARHKMDKAMSQFNEAMKAPCPRASAAMVRKKQLKKTIMRRLSTNDEEGVAPETRNEAPLQSYGDRKLVQYSNKTDAGYEGEIYGNDDSL